MARRISRLQALHRAAGGRWRSGGRAPCEHAPIEPVFARYQNPGRQSLPETGSPTCAAHGYGLRHSGRPAVAGILTRHIGVCLGPPRWPTQRSAAPAFLIVHFLNEPTEMEIPGVPKWVSDWRRGVVGRSGAWISGSANSGYHDIDKKCERAAAWRVSYVCCFLVPRRGGPRATFATCITRGPVMARGNARSGDGSAAAAVRVECPGRANCPRVPCWDRLG